MKKPFSKLFGLKNKDDIVGYIEEDHNSVESIHTERIVPNRYQPRQVFEPNKIKELEESIDEHGLLQTIVVHQIEDDMVENIAQNSYQTIKVFETNKIKELAESIDEHGLLQPIVVRPIEEDMFEIIAGERRFRALQSLNKTYADVIIRDLGDEETAVVALI